ncbi:hypothetical protein C8R43DRAFT_965775 [Mycena crocata]|nr:hypothetical protein C8R43DRAFT_965775 [Mycena crocata]
MNPLDSGLAFVVVKWKQIRVLIRPGGGKTSSIGYWGAEGTTILTYPGSERNVSHRLDAINLLNVMLYGPTADEITGVLRSLRAKGTCQKVGLHIANIRTISLSMAAEAGRRGRGYRCGPYGETVTTVADLGRNFTEEETEEFHRQRRITQRVYCKNVKGCSKPVWPLQVEAALMEGLYQYSLSQVGSAGVQCGKKYQRRNRYIADFIRDTTNEERSCKQVGSRIQQLQISAKDDRIVRLLKSYHIPEDEVKPLTMTLPLIKARYNGDGLSTGPIQVPVIIASRSAQFPSLPPEILLEPSVSSIRLRVIEDFRPSTSIISQMDPTIAILTPIALMLRSTLEVSKNKKPLWVSATILVPDADLWPLLSQLLMSEPGHLDGEECGQWTILQRVFRANARGTDRDTPLAVVSYAFESRSEIEAERRLCIQTTSTKGNVVDLEVHANSSFAPCKDENNAPSSLVGWDKMSAGHTATAQLKDMNQIAAVDSSCDTSSSFEDLTLVDNPSLERSVEMVQSRALRLPYLPAVIAGILNDW